MFQLVKENVVSEENCVVKNYEDQGLCSKLNLFLKDDFTDAFNITFQNDEKDELVISWSHQDGFDCKKWILDKGEHPMFKVNVHFIGKNFNSVCHSLDKSIPSKYNVQSILRDIELNLIQYIFASKSFALGHYKVEWLEDCFNDLGSILFNIREVIKNKANDYRWYSRRHVSMDDYQIDEFLEKELEHFTSFSIEDRKLILEYYVYWNYLR